MRRVILLMLLGASFSSGFAAIVDVYVYNTDFSINLPAGDVEPAVITQGDSIRWVWVQGGHTTTAVVGSPEQWNREINSDSTEYIRQFNDIGVFWYYCIPHGSDNGDGTASGMASTITVLAAGSGACCLPTGECITSDESTCLSQNGMFSGVGTSCDTTTCQVTVDSTAAKDNILYQSATGALSNGEGIYLYAGNNSNGARRSVVAFDLSEIPAHAELESAQLQLYCNSASGSFPVAVHKLLNDWGEGGSDANGNEGSGAAAEPGDATWLHTFFDTSTWTIAGGDFATTVSDTTLVNTSNTFVSWSSQQIINDVSTWLENPSTNYGWILKGDESSTTNTVRFSSRQNNTAANHPRLLLDLRIPPRGACCLPDGSCADLSETQCTAQGGEYQGNGTDCASESCHIPLTPYLDALPLPATAIPKTGNAGGKAHYRMVMRETYQQLHSELPPTRVWTYGGTYPGPTIEAYRDSMVTVRWVNDLRVFETGELRTDHALTVDTCLHGPNMTGTVPVTVVHLHGGKVPPGSDGYPEDVFPPGDSADIYFYPNIQPATTMWYHDHALGITRLNVMMGLAGYYLIRDANEASLGLPSGEFEVPLAIQDKSFNPDGSIRYPAIFEDHFFGKVLLVNGKVWPYLNVKQGQYRFRMLNGSNSRTYTLHLSNGAPLTQISSDLGLLTAPVVLDSLTLLPGERADVIIDFSADTAGAEIVLLNSAPAPFPGFPGVGVIPNVMKFIVQGEPGYSFTLPDTLAVVEALEPDDAEEERLFELLTIPPLPCPGESHPVWTINGMLWDSITEFPVLGSTEIWTWHNQSGISHPMHMHLIAFQILDRQAIDDVTGLPVGPKIIPGPNERGWKDTAHSPPGYRTRVITKFTGYPGKYAYHCHILEHEDHEMMRQFEVKPCIIVTNTDAQGAGSFSFAVACAEDGDTILFSEDIVGDTISLSDTLMIAKNLTILNTHTGQITISGSAISHLFTIAPGVQVNLKNLVLISGNGSVGRAVINHGTLTLEDISIYDPATSPGIEVEVLNLNMLIIKNNVNVFSK